MPEEKIAIIILNWNNYADTKECIDSIYTNYPDHPEIIIVDNNSSDGSDEKIAKEFPEIDLIQSNENLGWAGGNNLGINFALDNDADYIFILNNDTILPPDGNLFEKLANFMNDNSDFGVISPLVRFTTGEIWFCEGNISRIKGFEHNLRGKDEKIKKEIVKNDWISGASIFVRREVFESVGMLNENYFMRGSDVEFSLRVKNKGYELATLTDSYIYHKVGQSSSDFDLSYYEARNRLWNIHLCDQVSHISYFIWFIKALLLRIIYLHPKEALDLFEGLIDGFSQSPRK
jgi:GT2 family glycosyltransferase